jgi:hypothetical protein
MAAHHVRGRRRRRRRRLQPRPPPAPAQPRVSFKRFGRKYTVPASEAPDAPTRQQARRAFKTRRYFDHLRERTAAVVASRAAIDAAAAAAGKAVGGPAGWGASAAPQLRTPVERAPARAR